MYGNFTYHKIEWFLKSVKQGNKNSKEEIGALIKSVNNSEMNNFDIYEECFKNGTLNQLISFSHFKLF